MTAKKQQLHTSVIFDIDSASIGVSVVGYESSTSLPDREYFSERTELKARDSFDEFFASTLKTLEELSHAAVRNAPQAIDSIYMVLGSPWMSSQKRVIKHTQEEAFVLTPAFVESLIETELKEPLSKNLDFHHFDNLEIFERRTIDIFCNGYPTLNPFDSSKKVNEVEVHSLTSVISTVTKQSFVHTIERVFHREPILLSNTFISYHTVRTLFPNDDDALVIDLGGVNTQMYVVEDDHLEAIASFPVGKEHIIAYISEHASVSRTKAKTLLQMYTQEMLDETYQDKLGAIMDGAYHQWMKECYNVCESLSQKRLLPSTILLIAPKELILWMRFHLLKTDELIDHLHARSTPRVIDVSQFLSLRSQELGLDHLSDEEMIPIINVIGAIRSQHYPHYE